MNLVFWKGLIAAAIALPALILGTGGLDSGPKPGEYVNAFEPHHVTGPDKNTDTCPVCKYGAIPAVQVWTNGELPENIEKISATLEKAISKAGKDRLKAFVVDLNPTRESAEAMTAKLEKIASAEKLQNVALTYLKGPDAEAVGTYKINVAPEVKTTVIVYKDMKVLYNFVNMKADKEDLDKLYESAIEAAK